MARRGENIYRRKDGRYEGRYVIGKRTDGKTKFGYVYGYQYADVKYHLALKKALRPDRQPAVREAGPLLGDWLQEWLETEIMGSIKISSYQRYVSQIRRHILPKLGKIRLGNLTAGMAQCFLAGLLEGGLSARTASGVFRLLSAALRSAQEEGLISKNPCRKVRMPRREPVEQRVLSPEEHRAVLRAAMGRADMPVLLGLCTGMRLGEICALQWADIDWAHATLTVRRTAQRIERIRTPWTDGLHGKTVLSIGQPKSGHGLRVLPIPSYLMACFHALYEKGGPENVSVWGNRIPEPRTFQRRFERMTKGLGLEGIHFHTLRHTFATRLIEQGVDIKTVSALLGHSSTKTTLDFYVHSLLQRQREAVERLNPDVL